MAFFKSLFKKDALRPPDTDRHTRVPPLFKQVSKGSLQFFHSFHVTFSLELI